MLNFYIVKDVEKFKQEYSDFGFEESKRVIYPKRVIRTINDDLKDKYIDMYDKIFNEQIKLIQKHEFYTEKLKKIDLITETYL